jgi:hypothetical protein
MRLNIAFTSPPARQLAQRTRTRRHAGEVHNDTYISYSRPLLAARERAVQREDAEPAYRVDKVWAPMLSQQWLSGFSSHRLKHALR